MKKTLIIGLVLLLFSLTFAFATVDDETGAVAWYSFDEGFDDISNGYDLSILTSAPFIEGTTFKLGNGSLGLDGTDDKLSSGTSFANLSNTFTVCTWAYRTDTGSGAPVHQTDGASFDWELTFVTTNFQSSIYDGVNQYYKVDSVSGDTNAWHHYCITYDGSHFKQYRDGVYTGDGPNDEGSLPLGTVDEIILGARGSNHWQGYLDEMGLWDETKSATGISAIYNLTENPFATTTPTDKVFPRVIEYDFTNIVSINSPNYQNVYSETFTALNTSTAYTNWVVELESVNKDTEITCQVLLNGSSIGSEQSRTILTGASANMYLFSNDFNITQDESYQIDLQCKRDATNGAIFRVVQASSLVNIYSSSAGNQINHESYNISAPINSTSYQVLYNTTFTTSNLTGDPNILSVFADGNIEFNYTSAGTISLYASLDGQNSSEFHRYGSAGSLGNGGGLYLLKNLTNETNYTFTIYGKSTTADGSVNINGVLTELFVDNLEAESSDLTNLTATTGTWATIDTIYINNTVTNGDILAKTSFSVESDSGTQILFFRLKAGTETTLEYERTINAGQSGMAVLQHAFSDVGLTNQSIEFQAYTSTAGATFTGGSVFAHVTEEVPAELRFYTVQARNEWNNNTITSFNVTLDTGTLYESNASGVVTVFDVNGLQNFTVTAVDYFDLEVLNHNTTQNVTVDMLQSDITFNASQLITNASVNGNITIDGQTKETGESFFLAAGTYNATFTASGYFPKTQEITVTALDNTTLTIVNVGNSLLKLNATNFVSDDTETDFNVTFWYGGVNLDNYTTTNGSIFIPVVQGSNFTIIVDDNLHALQTFYIVPNSTYHNETLVLATTNSVFITFRDEVSKALINGTNMTALLVGANSYTYTTTNGTLYQDLITPSEYEIRYYSTNVDDYKLRSYFFELTNLSFNNITLYALNESENVNFTSATTTFNVLDDNFNPVENAKVVVQRYYADQNGYVSVWERFTNSDGYSRGVFETFDAFYKYNVYYNDELKFSSSNNGVQFTTDETFTIYISTLSNYGGGIATVNDLAYTTSLDFAQTGNFTGYFELNYTNENLLQICLWVEYLNGTSVSSSCQSSSSGTIQSSVSAPTDQSTTYVAYAVGYDPTTEQYIVFKTDSFTFRVLDLLGTNDDITSAAAFVAVLILTAIGLLLIKYPVVAILTQTALFVFIALSPIPFIIGGIQTTIAWIVSVAITAVVILVRGKNE